LLAFGLLVPAHGKGGKSAKDDLFICRQDEQDIIAWFRSLGITLQINRTPFFILILRTGFTT
jgi:hypothetical protein